MKKIVLLGAIFGLTIGVSAMSEAYRGPVPARGHAPDDELGVGEYVFIPPWQSAGVPVAPALAAEYSELTPPVRPASDPAADVLAGSAAMKRGFAAAVAAVSERPMRVHSPVPNNIQELQENLENKLEKLEDKLDAINDKLESIHRVTSLGSIAR